MPLLGFGTWKLVGDEAYEAVTTALQAGYRHIDTAMIYRNEKEVGRAIKDSGIAREDLFVTTKLWNDDHNKVAEAMDSSLQKLGLQYVDLYLMHWPEETRLQAYKDMEKLLEAGKTKAIGVSNFTIRHLDELLSSTSIVPAVNQVEFNPFLNQQELVRYCQEKDIVFEAYCPLARARYLNDERLVKLAGKYQKTPAQILLRWSVQQNIVVIPKSSNEGRIKENLNIFDFELHDTDMQEMNTWNENARYCSDPTDMP